MVNEYRVLGSREEWLFARKGTIGGSDAACVIGKNPWKSNVQLWKEMTGKVKPKDISNDPLVKYGTDAEAPLRELFKLDYPNLEVGYEQYNIFRNDKYPFAHASLDGWFMDENGRIGGLEVKTTLVMASSKKEEWNDRIPNNYYTQVIHSLMVTEFDCWCLKAQLKWVFPNDDNKVFLQTRHYWINRSEVEEDIKFLAQAEEQFYEQVMSGIRPAEILPDL